MVPHTSPTPKHSYGYPKTNWSDSVSKFTHLYVWSIWWGLDNESDNILFNTWQVHKDTRRRMLTCTKEEEKKKNMHVNISWHDELPGAHYSVTLNSLLVSNKLQLPILSHICTLWQKVWSPIHILLQSQLINTWMWAATATELLLGKKKKSSVEVTFPLEFLTVETVNVSRAS